jgi:hypothetical protein
MRTQRGFAAVPLAPAAKVTVRGPVPLGQGSRPSAIARVNEYIPGRCGRAWVGAAALVGKLRAFSPHPGARGTVRSRPSAVSPRYAPGGSALAGQVIGRIHF